MLPANWDIISVFDPGNTGAQVSIDRGRNVWGRNTKDGYAPIIEDLHNYRIRDGWVVVGAMEKLYVRPGDVGKKSHMVTKMLKAAGRAMLCFELEDVPYEEIEPTEWQYPHGLVGYAYKDRKKLAVIIASVLFGVKATLDNADALLIANYMWHKLTGTPFPPIDQRIVEHLNITKVVKRGRSNKTKFNKSKTYREFPTL